MLNGLWKLTWLEVKIFAREPLGLVGSVAIPVIAFLAAGRLLTGRQGRVNDQLRGFVAVDLPVMMAIVISLGAVLSLVTIIAIYREGGILKRLRATPLRPHTILTAHVLVKLLFTAVTMLALVAAGKQYYPAGIHAPVVPFTLALMASTVSIISMGFLIASIVPTARFAQPIGTLILYPMLAVSGLFVPIAALPPPLQIAARLLPTTYAASLLKGIWRGDGWSAHTGDLTGLVVTFVVCTALSARVFRWE